MYNDCDFEMCFKIAESKLAVRKFAPVSPGPVSPGPVSPGPVSPVQQETRKQMHELTL